MVYQMQTKRLWVDFNETYDDDYVWTSLRHAPPFESPQPGEVVVLYDDDDETCMATVSRIDGPIVHCKIDWSTRWRVEFKVISTFPS